MLSNTQVIILYAEIDTTKPTMAYVNVMRACLFLLESPLEVKNFIEPTRIITTLMNPIKKNTALIMFCKRLSALTLGISTFLLTPATLLRVAAMAREDSVITVIYAPNLFTKKPINTDAIVAITIPIIALKIVSLALASLPGSPCDII